MRTRRGGRVIHTGGASRKKYDRASLLPNVILQLIPYLGAQELRAIRAAAIFFRDTVDGYIVPLAGRRREALESACPAGAPDIFLYTIQKTARLSIRVLDSPSVWGALRTLHLRSNQLAALPESFGHLTALQTLYLDFNQLTALPGSFGRLTLSDLHLHGMRVGVDARCADLLARLGISNTFYYLHPPTA